MANLGEQVKKMAQQSGLSLADYFDLLTIYYQVDAGSHTKDAGGLEALDYLFDFDHEKNEIRFAPAVQVWVDELRKSVLGESKVTQPSNSLTVDDSKELSQTILEQLQPAIGRAADAAVADELVLTNGDLWVFMLDYIRQSPEYTRLFSGNAPNDLPSTFENDLAQAVRDEFTQREIIVELLNQSLPPNNSSAILPTNLDKQVTRSWAVWFKTTRLSGVIKKLWANYKCGGGLSIIPQVFADDGCVVKAAKQVDEAIEHVRSVVTEAPFTGIAQLLEWDHTAEIKRSHVNHV